MKIFLSVFLLLTINVFAFGKDIENVSVVGIWKFDDAKKMIQFLGLKEMPTNWYAMDIRNGEKNIVLQFLYTKKKYSLKLEKIKNLSYRVYNKYGKYRNAEISIDKGNKNYLYWHFTDSSPYNPKRFAYDGIKEEYDTLTEAIDDLQKEYEEIERTSNTRDNE
jgi:hypothetical protein